MPTRTVLGKLLIGLCSTPLWISCATSRASSEPVPSETSIVFRQEVLTSEPIQWEVLSRFRLLKLDATEEFFEQFLAYTEAARREPDNRKQFQTWWDPSTGNYEPGYISIKEWKIRLRAGAPGKCSWVVTDNASGSSITSDEPCDGFVTTCGAQGCKISARVSDLGSTDTGAKIVEVRPRSVVIATMGDSYASGEGVPDLRGTRLFKQPVWMDRRCHRSLYSGHSLAGLMYAMANPHVAVTHVSYACSGALLSEGLLHTYKGIEPGGYRQPIPAQIDQLRATLAGQRADYLTLSFGGNDLGFGKIVDAAARQKDEAYVATLHREIEEGFPKARASLKELVGRLTEGPALAQDTILVGYPNPTVLLGAEENKEATSAMVNRCAGGSKGAIRFVPAILAPFVPTMGTVRIGDLEDQVAKPLRAFSKEMADALSAEYIGDLDEAFKTHGFCGPGLTPENGGRWINTVRDSWQTQGFFRFFGAMHPNIRGQEAIGKAIFERILVKECVKMRAGEDPLVEHLCSGVPAAVPSGDAR